VPAPLAFRVGTYRLGRVPVELRHGGVVEEPAGRCGPLHALEQRDGAVPDRAQARLGREPVGEDGFLTAVEAGHAVDRLAEGRGEDVDGERRLVVADGELVVAVGPEDPDRRPSPWGQVEAPVACELVTEGVARPVDGRVALLVPAPLDRR
jgi:hypothetical protein